MWNLWNRALSQFCGAFSFVLTFANFTDSNELPTLDSIDAYMSKLQAIVLEAPQENESLITRVREIISHLNFEGWHSKIGKQFRLNLRRTSGKIGQNFGTVARHFYASTLDLSPQFDVLLWCLRVLTVLTSSQSVLVDCWPLFESFCSAEQSFVNCLVFAITMGKHANV